MTVAATLAVQLSCATAFKAGNDYTNILKLLRRQLRKLAKYNAAVMIDQPAHELMFDRTSTRDVELVAASWPPGGEAGVTNAVSASGEEIAGIGGEVELLARGALPGSQQGEGTFQVGDIALEARQNFGGVVLWLVDHGELYRRACIFERAG
jgi:hypothetical protein